MVGDLFPQAVDSKPRTKEDFFGFSDGEDDEHSDTDGSIDVTDIKPNVKFLPATVERLADWLSKEYKQHGKHEHRNELVFLLLRQDGINRDENAQLNNMLAESLDDNKAEIESTKDEAAESAKVEDETREGKLKKIISFNTDYLKAG